MSTDAPVDTAHIPHSAAAVLADKSSKGFEDVLQRIQSKELIASVSGLLAAVDGPNALPPMSPRLQRSPRAVEAARQQQVCMCVCM